MTLDRIFIPYQTETERINAIITQNAPLTDAAIVALELSGFLISPARKLMETGEAYYRNHTDIQKKQRLHADGTPLLYRENTRLEHAFYRKMVDQITGYMLSLEPTIAPVVEDKTYSELLNGTFDREYKRAFNAAGRGAINQGITWLQPYITQDGKLKYKYIPGYEVRPLWRDAAHTEADGIIRTYEVQTYRAKSKFTERKAEVWTTDGVTYYIYDNGTMRPDPDMTETRGNAHFYIDGKPYNWARIPFVAVRYNDIEQPLIDIIKSNIDTYNKQASIHADLLADIPSALIAVMGYGGDPDKVLYNIKQKGIALLQEGGNIDVKQTEPQTDAVETMLTRVRRDIFSFGAGVDGQDEGQANKSGVALQQKRSDLDTVCNNFEVELQYAFEQIAWFAQQYYLMTGKGDYTDKPVKFVINRDIVVAEAQTIENIKNSVGIISKKTLIENHPFVNDANEELQQMKDEEAEAQKQFIDQTNAAYGTDPREDGGGVSGA